MVKAGGHCELPHSDACPQHCSDSCSGQLQSHSRSCNPGTNKVLGSPCMSLCSFRDRGVEGGTGSGAGALSRARLGQKTKKIIPLQGNSASGLYRDTSSLHVVPKITITALWHRTFKYFNKESVRFRREQEGSVKTERKVSVETEFPGKVVH